MANLGAASTGEGRAAEKAGKGKARVFLALLGSSYGTQLVRILGALALRLVLPAASVGLINAAQSSAGLFSAITAGQYFTAARTIPGLTGEERTSAAMASIVASLVEAVLVLPIGLMIFAHFFPDIAATPGLLVATGLFWLTFRVLAVAESILQCLEWTRVVVVARMLRVTEVFAGLFCAWLAGHVGYLLAGTLVTSMLLLWITRQLREARPRPKTIIGLLVPHRYGVGVAADKFVTALALQIDSLIVFAIAGPATLAGYNLGVMARGTLITIISNLYWTLWPGAARVKDMGHDTIFHSWQLRVSLAAGLGMATFAGLAILYVILRWVLPDYSNHILEISLLALSVVPIALLEMDKAVVLLGRRVAILPVLGALRPAGFAAALAVLTIVPGCAEAVFGPNPKVVWSVAAAGYLGPVLQHIGYQIFLETTAENRNFFRIQRRLIWVFINISIFLLAIIFGRWLLVYG
ncbi:hypothetical protein [Radicibacter daui]|uniref:hypothetical protein n=1 Tax=Radicibacter daui TaxID=3064829 RepID=UPI0040469BC8